MAEKKHEKLVAQNKKARYNYFIEDTYEAGIVLKGTEVKSLRQGRASLKDSYARIKNGEVFVYQMHISPYPWAHYDNHDPLQTRKLLLHKYEIKKLYGKVNEAGYSLIPLKLYFKNGKVKVLLGLAKGKRQYDKRAALKQKQSDREVQRAMRRNQEY